MENMKQVRVNRYIYDVSIGIDPIGRKAVVLTPRTGGDTVYSTVRTDNYAYTHGGKTYRMAVIRAKEIAEEME